MRGDGRGWVEINCGRKEGRRGVIGMRDSKKWHEPTHL